MKIQKVEQNYCAYGKPHSTSFAGRNLGQDIVDLLPNKKAINVLSKFKKFNGEGGGILINAIGTGAIAPLFIAYNPFVKAPKDAPLEKKEDIENTKKYTALRQPISAILAILIQFGLQKPMDIALDALFNDPNVAKHLWLPLDQSALNNDGYVTRKIAKEMKKENVHFKDKKEYKAELQKRVEAYKDNQLNKVIQNLKNDKQIKIGSRIVEDKELARVINKQLDNYIDDVKSFIVDEKGLIFYKDRAEMLINNEDELRRILNNVPSDEKALENYLKNHISNTKNPDVKTILEEIINYPSKNLRESRCARTLERYNTIKKACGGNYSSEKYVQSMLDDNAFLRKFLLKLESCKVKNLDGTDINTVKKQIKNTIEACYYNHNDERAGRIFNNIYTFLTDKEKLSEKIHKDIVKCYKNVISNKYKGFNQLAKIVIGALITVPVTCTVLNWVYPRFMDIFFPKLSGTKKGGDK